MDYTLDGIVEFLKKNDVAATAVRESLAGPDLRRLGDKVVAIEAERDAAVVKIKAISEERDALKLKDELAAKRVKVTTVIAAHELGKKYGHLPSTASVAFVESLMGLAEEEWLAKLDDRLTLVTEALKPPVTTVQSAPKPDGPGAKPTEISEEHRHAALRKALAS